MSQTTTYLESPELLERSVGVASEPPVSVASHLAASQQRSSRAPQPAHRPFNYRQLFWKWHLYAGLFGAPLMILIALTGALLVFAPEIDRLIRPDLWRIEPPAGLAANTSLADQALVDIVRRQFPQSKFSSYRQNSHADEPYQFLMQTPGIRGVHDVWINQYTGQIVGQRYRETAVIRVAEQLHRRLLTGEVGSSIIEFITGWCIVLTLTGLYLWWPKSLRQLYSGLVPTSRGSAYKVNWRLHNVTGAWTAAVLLLLAITGMVFSTYTGKMFNMAIAWTGGRKSPPAATAKAKPSADAADASPLAIDLLLAKAREAAPAGTKFNVQLSREKGGQGVTISTLRPERATWADRKNYRTWSFDQNSGALLSQSTWSDTHPLLKFRQLSLVIHFGSVFGLPTKIIAALASLAVPLLAVTGFLIWWWKRPGKAAVAARPPAVPRALAPATPISPWIVAGLPLLCLIFPTIGVSFFAVILFESFRARWRSRRAPALAA